MRRVSWVAAGAAVALSASGCAHNDYFEYRAGRYDVAVEQSRDEMLLTNVIRASRAEPLAFQQLGQIAGSSQTSANLGLPSLVFGPTAGLTAAQQTLDKQAVFGANPLQSGFSANSAATMGATTFNVTPAETRDFYRGLLTTVAPETLGFFRDQGIARETLFYLFTDKVSETKGGPPKTYVNDPISDSFGGFQNYVRLAMRYGLSSEPTPGYKPAPAEKKSSGGGGGEGNEVAPSAEWRLCFDKSLADPGTVYLGNRPICGSKDKVADERTVSFLDSHGVSTILKVYPRSTFSIFQYLGRLVAEGDAGRIQLITDEAKGKPPLFDDTLFSVASGTIGISCFLYIDYARHGYCVPEDGALNTKRILGLLAQLLALNTSVRDISNVPQVQVIP